MRIFTAVLGSVGVGGLAAWGATFAKTDLANDPLFIVSQFVLWGGLAGLVLLLAGRGCLKQHPPHLDNGVADLHTDENGVARHFGDVFDQTNFPVPGAHGRIHH